MIPRVIPYQPPPAAGGSHNATVTAWMNQVITDGGTVSAGRRTLLDTLFNAGITNGWLAKLDYFAILAAENTQSALRDFINLRALTNHSSTFTTDRGYAGNGSSTYVDSGFNPSTMGSQFTQNAASIACWDRATSSSQNAAFASEFSTNGSGILPPRATDQGFYQVNTGGAVAITAQTSNGLWHANRTASGASNLFKNGTSIHTDTDTSNAIPSANFGIGCDISAGSPAIFCSDQIAVVAVGGNMVATAAAFYSDLNIYAAAVGF